MVCARMATDWGYDAVLVERGTGDGDDVNQLRYHLYGLKGQAHEMVSIVPDPRGWIVVTWLPLG